MFHLDNDLSKNSFTNSAFILAILRCILAFDIRIVIHKLCLGIKITKFFMYLRKLNNPGNGFFFYLSENKNLYFDDSIESVQ